MTARDYDAIVVGAGLGGLSAGAFLSQAGKRVLVIDRLDGPGGYAHAFKRGPYTFDPAIHWTPQGYDGLIWDSMLRAVGVRDRCTLLPIDSFYEARFPGVTVHPGREMESFIEAHARHFPDEADGIAALCVVAAQVTAESQQLPPALSLVELDEAVKQFPTLFRYRTKTVAEVFDEFLQDPRAKAALAASWPYMGPPPHQFSFYTWAAMVTAVFTGGIFYCQGSFQQIPDALAFALQRNGGDLLLERSVTKILVSDGRVTGVRLDDGTEVSAPYVISNADATLTFRELVGAENLPGGFLRRLGRLTPSPSAFVVFAATPLDLHRLTSAHETFVYRHWDHAETYNDILAGRPGGLWVNVPSLVDPSLAPAGEHVMIMTSLAAYDIGVPWAERREQFADECLDILNGLFPGVRENLTYIETATPETLRTYSLNRDGAVYGWQNTPHQANTGRPSPHTPIEGLFLSGHWTQPGTGSLRSTYSGVLCAQIILGYPSPDAFLNELIGGGALQPQA